MKLRPGNSKLGNGVVSMSRPVGDTCPRDCAYHPESASLWRGYCYMIRIEGTRPFVREAAKLNQAVDIARLVVALREARRERKMVRLHVGGDFYDLAADDLDWPYIRAWREALSILAPEGLPQIIAYTHCLDGRLVEAFRPFQPAFKLYASVHGSADLARARALGFEQFALAMPEDVDDYNNGWLGRARLERHDARWLVCPAQTGHRLSCTDCRYCWDGLGNVAFLEHSKQFRRRGLPKRPHGTHPLHASAR